MNRIWKGPKPDGKAISKEIASKVFDLLPKRFSCVHVVRAGKKLELSITSKRGSMVCEALANDGKCKFIGLRRGGRGGRKKFYMKEICT